MQIAKSFFFFSALSVAFLFFTTEIQCFEPASAPVYEASAKPPSLFGGFASPAPESGNDSATSVVRFSPESPVMAEENEGLDGAPSSQELVQNAEAVPEEEKMVMRWCAVREELEGCQLLVSVLKETNGCDE